MNTDFDLWMARVNTAVESICGLGIEDLPDWMYRDAFEGGRADFDEIAREVLEDAGYGAFI